MEKRVEFRSSIKFCSLLGYTPTQTENHLRKAYGESSVSRSLVFKWHKRFRDGQESVADDVRPGRPRTAVSPKVIDSVKSIVHEDRRVTIGEIISALNVDISYGSVQSILTETLKMRRVCARWIPRLLKDEQKARRVDVARDFLRKVEQEGDSFLDDIITMDETWLHMFDPESKAESSVWKHTNSPPPKKARVIKSMAKVMFVIFFDRDGVILSHAVPKGTTINAKYFSDVSNTNIISTLRIASY